VWLLLGVGAWQRGKVGGWLGGGGRRQVLATIRRQRHAVMNTVHMQHIQHKLRLGSRGVCAPARGFQLPALHASAHALEASPCTAPCC
jgi:hypothetical protein